MTIRPRRSMLFMPGSNARAIEKARTLPVDGVIIDLEDAVAPEAKEQARQQVVDAVKQGGFGAREVFIRVNAIDTHVHYPQMQVMGSYAGALLEWLNKYTFVEEQKFADKAHAERIAGRFFDELIRHGTTTAVTYCSVHKASADAYFVEAEKRNMLAIAGKVMMDRNSPEALRDVYVPLAIRYHGATGCGGWRD